jgi:hypothetical protein
MNARALPSSVPPRALLTAVLLAAGCGGSVVTAGTEGDAGAATTVEAGCAAQSAADCTLRNTCSGGIGSDVDYGSTSACTSQLTEQCLANFAAPETATTLAHINGCTAAYGSESCTDWADDDPSVACQSPHGTRANGARCGVNSQCSSGLCIVSENAECGTCQAPPAPGAPCNTENECGYDLACPFYVPARSGVCTAFGATGATCDNLHPCQGGLACVGADTSTGATGTCQTAATSGQSCNDRTGPACDGTLFLGCVDGTCVVETLVGAGQPCGSQQSGYNRCTGGAACVTPFGPCQHDTGASCGSVTGTCVAPAANGSPCDTLEGPLCLTPAKCVLTSDGGTAGTCVFPDPASCG